MADQDILIGFDSIIGNGRIIRTLPINPNVIQINESQQIDLVDIIGTGQVSILGAKRLRKVEFSSIFPVGNDIVKVLGERSRDPRLWVKFIEDQMELNKPLNFFLSSGVSAPSTTFRKVSSFLYKMVIEDFTWRYRGGWGTDIEYDLVLQEFKEAVIRTVFLDTVEPLLPGNVNEARNTKEKQEEAAKELSITMEQFARRHDIPMNVMLEANESLSGLRINGDMILTDRAIQALTLYGWNATDAGLMSPAEIEIEIAKAISDGRVALTHVYTPQEARAYSTKNVRVRYRRGAPFVYDFPLPNFRFPKFQGKDSILLSKLLD